MLKHKFLKKCFLEVCIGYLIYTTYFRLVMNNAEPADEPPNGVFEYRIAQMYPKEDPKPVFSTTITFYSEDSAEKALEEDNALLERVRIRVKRPLAPTLTTLVVRSYAELSEQALSSVFSAAGRIWSIRQLVKGRNSAATAFIEFDGPKSVERAIKMAEGTRIGGKKIHVAKFEVRTAMKEKQNKTEENNENSDDSNE